VAALLALARAVQFAHIKPQRTILFVGDVGEEGEGNLRGMRAIVDTYRGNSKRLWCSTLRHRFNVTTKALASRRLEALNHRSGRPHGLTSGCPIPSMHFVRGSVRFITPKFGQPSTTFNIGARSKGAHVGEFCSPEARLKVDIRSES